MDERTKSLEDQFASNRDLDERVDTALKCLRNPDIEWIDANLGNSNVEAKTDIEHVLEEQEAA